MSKEVTDDEKSFYAQDALLTTITIQKLEIERLTIDRDAALELVTEYEVERDEALSKLAIYEGQYAYAAEKLDKANDEIAALKERLAIQDLMLETARRKLTYLLRDYPDDKETARWLSTYDAL